MSPSPALAWHGRAYNAGLIWAMAAFTLLLVLMAWFAAGTVPVVRGDRPR